MSNEKKDTFITNFIEHLANVGMQKSNRYIVFIKGPGEKDIRFSHLDQTKTTLIRYKTRESNIQTKIETDRGPGLPTGLGMSQDWERRLALNCCAADFGGKSINTFDFTPVASGPVTRFPISEQLSSELSLEFNCSTDFFERSYFSQWMNIIIDPVTRDVALYSRYAKPWKILVVMLPNDVSTFTTLAGINQRSSRLDLKNDINVTTDNEFSRNIYFLRFHEVYPSEIGDMRVSHEDPGILKFKVNFNFNYMDDPMEAWLTNYKSITEFSSDEPEESPFIRFRKILRDVARYSNPKELQRLIIDKGLGELGEIIGVENVEQIASGGQIIDVYRRQPNKDFESTQRDAIDPLGRILGGDAV